jgi:hypothetical protein
VARNLAELEVAKRNQASKREPPCQTIHRESDCGAREPCARGREICPAYSLFLPRVSLLPEEGVVVPLVTASQNTGVAKAVV